MKSTGVVRKIDELGRIVIPKEIRRTLRIRDGENLEIFVDDTSIILKKYSKMFTSVEMANQLCHLICDVLDYSIFVTDRDRVIAASGAEVSGLVGKENPEWLSAYLFQNESSTGNEVQTFSYDEKTLEGHFAVSPIITSMDTVGTVCIYSKEANSNALSITKLVAKMIVDKVDIA